MLCSVCCRSEVIRIGLVMTRRAERQREQQQSNIEYQKPRDTSEIQEKKNNTSNDGLSGGASWCGWAFVCASRPVVWWKLSFVKSCIFPFSCGPRLCAKSLGWLAVVCSNDFGGSERASHSLWQRFVVLLCLVLLEKFRFTAASSPRAIQLSGY